MDRLPQEDVSPPKPLDCEADDLTQEDPNCPGQHRSGSRLLPPPLQRGTLAKDRVFLKNNNRKIRRESLGVFALLEIARCQCNAHNGC